jgi:phytoene dehydrogenase-like protein
LCWINASAIVAEQFDIVVAGAGHNSLIATAYLAKAGYRCLVLESRALVGGGVKTAQLTLRGFHHDVCSSAHVLIQDSPILRNDELGLGPYGLEYLFPDPVAHIPFPDGTYLTQWRDMERTCVEFAKFSKKDADAYRRMMTEYEEIKPLFAETAYTPIGFGKSLNERLAEHPKGKQWQRRLAMSAWEIIKENFDDEHCRAFMVWMAYQTVEPPEAAVTGRLAYAICAGRQKWSWTTPKGGSGALTQALEKLIEAHGGTILTNKTIARLIVENEKCTGVECTDGSSYRASKAVVRIFWPAWKRGKPESHFLRPTTLRRNRPSSRSRVGHSHPWPREPCQRRNAACESAMILRGER